VNHDLEWQRRYEEEDTPWDKGAAAPALAAYLAKQPIAGRILVPGCGRGHDVRALASQPETTVVGLDLSPLAVAQARKLSTDFVSENQMEFVVGDFFDLPASMNGSFDWLVEHTCFCAIEPGQRAEYVRAAALAIKPKGKIFAIFFINPDTESGPPFKVSKEELNALFDPHFALVEEWVPRKAFPGREGRELVRILQKR
jgi:SAM-dependent methyltransferase